MSGPRGSSAFTAANRGPVSDKDFTPCESCELKARCYASRWNESGHPERTEWPRPPEEKDLVLTTVHTCMTCAHKTISTYNIDDGVCTIVPDNCPRWHPGFASATDCDGCLTERENLRRSHPSYAASLEAASRFGKALLMSIKVKRTNPENVADLDTEREVKESIREVSSNGPLAELQKALSDPEKIQRLNAAADLLIPLLGTVWDDTEFTVQRARCANDWRIEQHRVDWLDGLVLAIERHQEAEPLVHEWVLVFTQTPISRRTWTRWPLPQRKLIIRGWEMITREWLAAR